MDTQNIYSTGVSGMPCAGRVNFNTNAKNDFITNEAFKTLRSNLLFCSKGIKTILITSAKENEGKSTIATELSKSLAELNKKTLLIDADMRKSVILRRNLKSQKVMGLSELLSEQATLEQVLYGTQLPNLNVIFSGHFPPNPVELLSTEKFSELMEQLRGIYDYIIIDSPPLLPVIDASVISVYCDGAILVISSDNVRVSEAVEVKEQLMKSGCKILGAILNNITSKGKYKNGYYKKSKYYVNNDNKANK